MMWALTSYLPAGLVLCHDSSQRGFHVSATLPNILTKQTGYPFTFKVVTDTACRQQQETFQEKIK